MSQADLIVRLKEERDEALRSCNLLKGQLARQKQHLDQVARDRGQLELSLNQVTQQRDQLASRLASVLKLEDVEAKRKSSKPDTPEQGGPLPKPAVLSLKQRNQLLERLYHKSVSNRDERVKAMHDTIYKPLEEKRKGRVLKSQDELEDNVDVIYTRQVARRDALLKNLDETRDQQAMPYGGSRKFTPGEQRRSLERLGASR